MDTKALRQKILDLAIHGKLVPQDPNDEPASVLLERIRAEKERLIKEGKIKKGKKSAKTSDKPHYPFELPKGWEWTTLGEISNYGINTSVKVEEIDDNNWVLELEDIEKDSAKLIQKLSKNKREIKGTRHKFYKGNVLYSKLRTYLNKVLIASEDGYCTTEIMPFDTYGILSNEYICHVLRSSYFLDYTLQCGYGVKMPRLSTTDACNGVIPLPPLHEQYRIVKEIKRWFTLISMIEKEKDNLRETIKQAKAKVLDLAIHGKLVPQNPNDKPAVELLKRINPKAEIISDNGHYQKVVPFKLPNGWSWTTLGSITNYGSCTTSDVLQISDSAWVLELEDIEKDSAKILSIHTKKDREIKGVRRSFKKGEILYSKLRTYLNKVLVASQDGFCTTEIIPISVSSVIDNIFLCHVLRSQYFLDYTSVCGYGVKMPRLSTKDAQNGLVPLPPRKEQLRIVSKIEELFHQLDIIEESL